MNIVHQRLQNLQIVSQDFKTPADIVRHLGAVQAQDYLGSLWAIGLRIPKITEADVEQAIAEGTIIRTWPMRGTLHYVAPEDVRWMLSLMAPRVIARAAGRYRQLELNDKVFAQSEALFIRALEGGKQLTRPELYQVLAEANIETTGSRGLHILAHLAQKQLICFGPRRGKQPSFTLLDEWVSAGKKLEGDEALAEIASRYFTSHGPATIQDFAWWTGLKLSDAKLGAAMARAQLAQKEVNGQMYYSAPLDSATQRKSGTAWLLPAFDEYTVSYKDRKDIIHPDFMKKVNAGGGILNPVMVINGRVAGTWKRTLKSRSVTITLTPFHQLSDAHTQAFADAAMRYGDFLGLAVELKGDKLRE